MKQKLYIAGIINVGVIILGAIFKLNHYPGAGVLLVSGIALLLFALLPVALWSNYHDQQERPPAILNIVIWITSFVIFTSMLFKLMHWPGAGIMLIVALPFPYLVFLPVYLTVTSKREGYSIYRTINVLFLLAGFSVISALLALNVTRDRIDDSLDMADSYRRVETVLGRMDNSEGNTLMSDDIDKALAVIADYRRQILSAAGVSEEEWRNDTRVIANSATGRVSAGDLVRGGEPFADTRLEDALTAIAGLPAETRQGIDNSGSLSAAVGFTGNEWEHGQWSNMLLRNIPLSWVLIYLDGLETDLRYLRASL